MNKLSKMSLKELENSEMVMRSEEERRLVVGGFAPNYDDGSWSYRLYAGPNGPYIIINSPFPKPLYCLPWKG